MEHPVRLLRSRHTLLQMVIAMIALFSLYGCGSPMTATPAAENIEAAGPVTLSVLFEASADAHRQTMDELLAEFEETHPDIKLRIQSVLQKDLPEVLQTRLAGGDPPDVLFTVPARVPNLIRDDLLLDLKPYMPAGYEDAFGPNGLVAESSGDQVFGFPLSKGIRAVAYNKDLFEQAGVKAPEKAEEIWTWDEMVAVATKIQEVTAVPYGLQFEKPSFDGWVSFLFQSGGSLVSPDGKKATVNEPAGVEAIQWTVDLHQNGIAAPGILEGAEDPLRLFASGQSAMWLCTGSWSVRGLEAEVKNFEYGFTFVPKHVERATVVFGNDVVVMKTEYPEQAWKLVAFVTSADNITRISNAMGNFPSRIDAKNISFPRDDLVPFFVEQGTMGHPEMSRQMLMPFYGASRDRLLRELQAAVSNQKSAQAAADEMAKIIESELAKGN